MEDKTKANAALNRVTPAVRTVGVGAGALSAESSAFSSSSIPRAVSAGTSGAGFGRFVKRLAVAMVVLLVLGIGGIIAVSMFTGDDKSGSQNVAGEFQETEIPLADLPTGESFSLGASSLTINGPLRVNDTFVLAPQAQPVQAVAGQLFFDQTNNALTYYNGTDFVALQGNNVVSVSAGGPNVTVVDDGNGNVVISAVTSGGSGGTGGTVSSAGGTAGRIAKFTGVQSLGDSILSESGTTLTVEGSLAVTGGVSLGTPLSVSNGGIGANALAVNGVVVSNGTAALTSVTAGGAGLCLVSTAGAPAFAACPGGVGSAFVQDGNSFGQTAVLGTNDNFGLNFEVNTTTVMSLSATGAATLQNQTNSASAFRVLNAAGTTTVLTVNTTSPRVMVQGTGTAGAGGLLLFGNDGNTSIGEQGGGTDSDILAYDARVAHRFYIAANQSVEFSQNGLATFRALNDGFGGLNVIQSNENPVFSVSTAGTEGAVQIGYGSDTEATLFVLDADSDSEPTGTNGAMYYNASLQKFRCFENSAWVNCLPAGGGAAAFIQGGNSFGGAATLGTNDAFDLNFERGGATKLTVTANELSVASGIDVLLTGASAYISNPQNSPSGEAFGWDAAVGGNGVAVGRQASAGTGGAFGSPVAVGYQATAASWGVAIGGQSSTTGNEAVAIGDSASAMTTSVAIGTSSGAQSGGVAIGFDTSTVGTLDSIAIGNSAVAVASNQFVAGSNNFAINHVVFGSGVSDATPTGFTLQGTSGSGSNVAGASVAIAGGQSTGNASGGNVSVQISAPGGSGSSPNSLSTVATFSGTTGALTLQNAGNSENALRLFNAAGEQLLNVGTMPNANNLVTNGSIETNTTGWLAKGGASISRITSQQYIGLASLQVTTSAAAGDGARYNVTLASSTEYTVQFWAKLSSGTFTNMAFGYSSDGVAETDCKTGQQVRTGGWQVFNCTFTTGAVSGTPYFYWEQATGVARTVYIDALQIVPGPDIGVFYEGTIDVSGLNFNGPVAIQNDNDSQAAFQIQSAGGTTVFGADSLNLRVGINLIQAQAALHVTTIGTTSVTALFNQSGSSTQDILQLSKSNDLTVSVAHTGATTFQNLTNSTTAFRVLASNATFGSGTPLFVVDTTNSRAYIGNPTADSTGALLVLDTKNTTGDPTGVDGAMYFNSSMGMMRCHFDGKWRFCNDAVSLSWAYNFAEEFVSTNSTVAADHFGQYSWDYTVSGTNATVDNTVPADNERFGVVSLFTGTTSTGVSALYMALNADSWQPILIGGGEEMEVAVNLQALSTVGEEYDARIGICDTDNADCVDGVYFEYDRNTSTNWSLVTANNSTRTRIQSSTSGCGVGGTPQAVAASAWVRLKAIVNAAGSQVDYYVNDTFVGCITANIPTARASSPMMHIIKSAGSTERDMNVDYFNIRNTFTTRR